MRGMRQSEGRIAGPMCSSRERESATIPYVLEDVSPATGGRWAEGWTYGQTEFAEEGSVYVCDGRWHDGGAGRGGICRL